jgi:hypothetical protein
MSKEGFFRRWSRLKAQGADAADSGTHGMGDPGNMQYAGPEQHVYARAGQAPDAALDTAFFVDAGQPDTGPQPGAAHRGAGLWGRTRGAAPPQPKAIPSSQFKPLAQAAPHPPVQPQPAAPRPGRAQPTLDDIALLGPDSDFSAFVSQGVDKTVQRLALKKLFSDPHFSVMDGLDVYIDDYTRTDPLAPSMLDSLQHARSMFARLAGDEAKPQDQDGPGHKNPPAAPEPPLDDTA